MRTKDTSLMKRIEETINKYVIDHPSETPSIRKLAAAVKVSPMTVQRYLVAMDEAGIISYRGGEIVTDQIEKINDRGLKTIGISGDVPCGTPTEVEEQIEEYITLPMSILGGRSDDYFILRAEGESMESVGISEGDLVVVRKQDRARDGQIIAAYITEGESTGSTLKVYLHDDNGHPYLWAMNDSWDKEERLVPAKEFIIQGVAIRVIKDVDKRYA